MSIIYDALKKVEGDSAGFVSKGNQPRKKKSNQNKVKLTILIALFLGIIFATVFNFSYLKKINLFGWNTTENKKQDSLKQAITEPKQKNNQNTKLKTEVKKTALKQASPSYKLEGIVFDSSNPFAIINGKRFYQGDKINNFIVSKVNRDSVKLNRVEGKGNKVLSISF